MSTRNYITKLYKACKIMHHCCINVVRKAFHRDVFACIGSLVNNSISDLLTSFCINKISHLTVFQQVNINSKGYIKDIWI